MYFTWKKWKKNLITKYSFQTWFCQIHQEEDKQSPRTEHPEWLHRPLKMEGIKKSVGVQSTEVWKLVICGMCKVVTSTLWWCKYSGTQTPSGINTLYRIVKCPQLRGFRYISGGGGLCNRAVEHNVAMFSGLSLAICWWQRLTRPQYYE